MLLHRFIQSDVSFPYGLTFCSFCDICVCDLTCFNIDVVLSSSFTSIFSKFPLYGFYITKVFIIF